jgi:site-specific DNA recombinase
MTNDHLRAAIYVRVASKQQAKVDTITSQIQAVKRRRSDDGLECDTERIFVDDGHSGNSLVRPALQRLRDQAGAGAIDRLYVLSPHRLSRRFAHQAFLLEQLARGGVEVIFADDPGAETSGDILPQEVGRP